MCSPLVTATPSGAENSRVSFSGFLQHLHDEVAAEIGGHQNHRVAEVNFPPLAVAHEAPVKHLVEQVHHVPVRLFHFIQQHHAVRALTGGLGQNAALAVTHVARR